MTGLVVGMTGGTGLRTETLAIANNSLGRLHLTGATRTGTGRSGRHHNHSIPCCIGRKKDAPRTNTPFPHTIHGERLITILTPIKTPGQEYGSLNQSKSWSIKTTNLENKYQGN